MTKNDDESHYSGAGHYDDEENSEEFRDSVQRRNTAIEVVMTKKEKDRIRMFRWMVAGMLVMIVGVTVLAYFLLSGEETKKFETAVSTVVQVEGIQSSGRSRQRLHHANACFLLLSTYPV